MVRLLVVSHIRIYREGLRDTLSRGGDLQIVGAVASLEETLDSLNRSPVDTVLLDTGIPDALAFIEAVASRYADAKLVAFGLSDSPRESIMDYAEAGISGYAPKDSSVEDLIRVVLRVARGELECSAGVAGALLQRVSQLAAHKQTHSAVPDLTPREWQVARLICDGLTNMEVARSLNIRLATAKAHVHQVLGKLGARRRGEVVSRLTRSIPAARPPSNPAGGRAA
jgi:DNA-binding NarL/FixJ family response regulator